MRRSNILTIAIASIPVSLVAALTWIGVFTFVNGYIVKDLGYSNKEWTASTLWFLGGMMFWQLICTEITTRIGRRRSIVVAMLLAGAAYLGLALTSDLWTVRVLMGLMGLMVATGGAAWIPMVAFAGGDRPGRAMAVYLFVSTTTGSLGLITGGYLISAFNYKSAFVMTAVACIIATLMFIVSTRSLVSADRVKVISLTQLSRSHILKMVKGPFLVIVLVGVCLEPFNYHTMNQLAPNLARDAHHISERSITSLVALGRLPALLILAIVAHYVDRMHALRYYSAAIVLAGLCVIGLGKAPAATVVFGVYTLYYLIYGIAWGTNNSAIDRTVSPELRDSAFTLVAVVAIAAAFVTGVAHNRLVSAGLTLQQVFVVCGVIGAVAGVALLAYSFTGHSRRHPWEEEATGVVVPECDAVERR